MIQSFSRCVHIIVTGFASHGYRIQDRVIKHTAEIETAGIMADCTISIIRHRVILCLTNSIGTVMTADAITLDTAVIKQCRQETDGGMTETAVTFCGNMTLIFACSRDAVMAPDARPGYIGVIKTAIRQ